MKLNLFRRENVISPDGGVNWIGQDYFPNSFIPSLHRQDKSPNDECMVSTYDISAELSGHKCFSQRLQQFVETINPKKFQNVQAELYAPVKLVTGHPHNVR